MQKNVEYEIMPKIPVSGALCPETGYLLSLYNLCYAI